MVHLQQKVERLQRTIDIMGKEVKVWCLDRKTGEIGKEAGMKGRT